MRKKKATEPSDVEAAEVARVEQVAEAFAPDPFFARGDCREAMLDVIRSAADWSKFDEARQRDINAAIDNASRTIIEKLIRSLATDGHDTIPATIDTITLKDGGLKIVAKATFTPDAVSTLASTKLIEIMIADPAGNMGERGPARVDADQPELIPSGPVGDDDLVEAADPEILDEDAPFFRTGGHVSLKLGVCEVRVNPKNGMVEAKANGDDDFSIDLREATPDELVAERDRVADFEPA